MIRYSLVCEQGHEFESWFANSDTFDTQAKRGLVDCPHCGSHRVAKALMAPSVSTARKKDARAETRDSAMRAAIAAMPTPASPAPLAPEILAREILAPEPLASDPLASAPHAVTLLDEKQTALRAAIRELHDKVVGHSEDVGKAFPDQARKMHDGDLPARSIRGEATLEEAKELWDEGIPVLPLPRLPDDMN